EALLCEFARHPRHARANVEAIEEPLEAPTGRWPDVLEREVAVDDVNREAPESHAGPGSAKVAHLALLGGHAGGTKRRDEARDLAVAVDREDVLHERDAAQPSSPQAPRGLPHPAHDEREEIRRVGKSVTLAGAVDTGEDLGSQDPDTRGVVVESREPGRVRLEENRLEGAAGPRLEPDVGADHELPRR